MLVHAAQAGRPQLKTVRAPLLVVGGGGLVVSTATLSPRVRPGRQPSLVLGRRLVTSYTPACCTLAEHSRTAFVRESKDWVPVRAALIEMGPETLDLSRLGWKCKAQVKGRAQLRPARNWTEMGRRGHLGTESRRSASAPLAGPPKPAGLQSRTRTSPMVAASLEYSAAGLAHSRCPIIGE